ncbi:MAG: hypothetical protein AAF518_00860 [Spirochaetota bacterium]
MSQQVRIERWNAQLEGEGELQKRIYSFRYTSIGDHVTFEERGKRKRKYLKVLEVDKVLPKEQAPCKSFGQCGGCAGQHIPYQEQFFLKTDRIIQEFAELTGQNMQSVAASQIYGHRNRMDFTVQPGPIIGFRQAGNFRVTANVEKCLIQSEWANNELKNLRNWLQQYPDLPRKRNHGPGYLKYITLRKAIYTDDTMLILTFSQEIKNTELLATLQSEVLQHTTAKNIIFCYNRPQSEVSAQGDFEVLSGNPYYIETLLEKKLEIPFDSFFQPNPSGFLPILEFLKKHLADIKTEELLDIFCGNGFFSILLGEHFSKLQGFDIVKSSIQQATQQLEKIYPHKETNYQVIDLYSIKNSTFLETIHHNTVAIIDPPRNGIGTKVLDILQKLPIKNLFYVSCNPKVQLQELQVLQSTYTVKEGLITDPYPHSPHLESVVFLQRKT